MELEIMNVYGNFNLYTTINKDLFHFFNIVI